MLDCYYIDLEGDCSLEQSLILYEKLSADRRNKVDKLKNSDMKRKQIIIGAFLQHVLGLYIPIPTNEFEFEYNEYGKPFVKGVDIHFNMSHSGRYALAAVSDSNVGVDIERRRSNRINVAKRCFCKEEYEYIMAAESEDEREERFLEYWTLKEAYIKYIGAGLSIPLNSFRVVRKSSISDIHRYGIITGIHYMDDTEHDFFGSERESVVLYSCPFEETYRFSLCCQKKKNGHDIEMLSSCGNVKKIDFIDILDG